MRTILKSLMFAFVAVSFASCAEAGRGTTAKPAAHGSRFEGTGKVSLHPGQPCTPQIMFDFRNANASVWLAARVAESRTLTDAARRRKSVHISGVWRRAKSAACEFVDVTRVTMEKRFLGIFPQ